jgi:hypothetical protein
MIMNDKAAGLCETCINVSTCSLKSISRAIIFCEEFDNFIPPMDHGSERLFTRARVGSKEKTVSAGAEICRGLCMNCERRSQCALSKPEGGVWHCEEYV